MYSERLHDIYSFDRRGVELMLDDIRYYSLLNMLLALVAVVLSALIETCTSAML
jgi:hypothetical protein